ncbi:MAG: 16S rRNA (cytidine(1402)-2'-O)-methyltransferase, partial [Bacilli bacterium]
MSQKSYNNSATLYLIPTPIGNMEDMTYRAVKILNEVEIVLSEDTRVTGILLKHYNIKKRLIANHEHNEIKNKEMVINLLEDGKSIGLVSDRGTPVISDPGFEIAKYAIEKGYNVVALPGATALIPALICSGLNPMPFTFYGFLNSKESKRKTELETLKNIKNTIIFYEAPHRITKTLENVLDILGNRKMCVAREISKKFEEIYRGTVKEVIEETKDIKGE